MKNPLQSGASQTEYAFLLLIVATLAAGVIASVRQGWREIFCMFRAQLSSGFFYEYSEFSLQSGEGDEQIQCSPTSTR
ncbi:MAG: hypothetical protein NZO16_05730 [Deltaproteobacteria bacterium]|nr:hypothetical protein [Deltaproteobacteria bacterium]